MKSRLNFDDGFSMTEVLVSIFILASGVLGMVGLQAAATRTTQQSAYQTTALQLAADVADTVHAMSSDEGHAHFAEPILDVDYTFTPGDAPTAAAPCHFASCSTTEFAEAELSQWKARLAAGFPAARIRICRDDTSREEAELGYSWDCSGEPGAPRVVKVGWKIKNPDGRYVDEGALFPPAVVVPVAPT